MTITRALTRGIIALLVAVAGLGLSTSTAHAASSCPSAGSAVTEPGSAAAASRSVAPAGTGKAKPNSHAKPRGGSHPATHPRHRPGRDGSGGNAYAEGQASIGKGACPGLGREKQGPAKQGPDKQGREEQGPDKQGLQSQGPQAQVPGTGTSTPQAAPAARSPLPASLTTTPQPGDQGFGGVQEATFFRSAAHNAAAHNGAGSNWVTKSGSTARRLVRGLLGEAAPVMGALDGESPLASLPLMFTALLLVAFALVQRWIDHDDPKLAASTPADPLLQFR